MAIQQDLTARLRRRPRLPSSHRNGLDFTMTGRTGTLRLKLRNTADYPVNVRVRLGAASNKLTFPPENVYQLAPNDTTELQFEIKARANGRFPVYLMLLAPGDTGTMANPLYAQTRFTATVYGVQRPRQPRHRRGAADPADLVGAPHPQQPPAQGRAKRRCAVIPSAPACPDASSTPCPTSVTGRVRIVTDSACDLPQPSPTSSASPSCR